MLDPSSGQFNQLSPSAALIYSCVDGAATITEIVHAIARQTGLAAQDLHDDVVRALETMSNRRLVLAEPNGPHVRSSPAVDRSSSVNAVDPARLRQRKLVDLGSIKAGPAAVNIRAELPVADTLTEIISVLPSSSRVADSFITVVDAGEDTYETWLDGLPLSKAEPVDCAARAVLIGLNQAAATHASDAILLHAGVVARGGRALVVCGESGAGKSSLVAALIVDGWEYLTDEVAAIDPDGWKVTPYPKWIDLSSDALTRLGLDPTIAIGPLGPKLHIPPLAIGAIGETARVDRIIQLVPSGHSESEPRALDSLSAVRTMLGNVFPATWTNPRSLQAVADLVTTHSVVELGRSDMDDMVRHANTLFDEPE